MDSTPTEAMPRTHASLTGHGLAKRIGERTLWSDVDLRFAPGTISAITGPSGSGKTTLLNVLGLLERPSAGHLAHGEHSWHHLAPRQVRRLYRDTIAFLFQNYALADQLTVRANLALAVRSLGVPRQRRPERIASALEAVGLTAHDDAPVYTLSGGEQQRVAIARVIAHQPRIVLADEPTAALDPGNAETIVGHLRRLADDGAIVVMTTHDPGLSARADHVVAL